ncbi:hypothetical protein A6770_18860 [Nostoc minutum NIES-26]|uniref:CHAT domain-containing protein n=1 Tax=Nostoc minutum NIES-26 TaxID=1844469 RepID=A0A367RAC0_9NOSO|nr:hypothetical protein A6770_18860 [Nostoc minutum NIES-26]
MKDDVALKSILLLAANPQNTSRLSLQEEEREIKERLRLSGYGKLPINSTGATRPRDILQAMLDFSPQIVHFSGHGSAQNGLVFEDNTGREKLVSSEALADLFRIFSDRVECVVLNACYSKIQAEAIAQHIEYVIGMNQSVGDRAAIAFSVGFYSALGAGRSIEFAYKLGCNAMQLEGIPEHLTPCLLGKAFRADKSESLMHDLIELLNPVTLDESVENTESVPATIMDASASQEFHSVTSVPFRLLLGILSSYGLMGYGLAAFSAPSWVWGWVIGGALIVAVTWGVALLLALIIAGAVVVYWSGSVAGAESMAIAWLLAVVWAVVWAACIFMAAIDLEKFGRLFTVSILPGTCLLGLGLGWLANLLFKLLY